MKDDGKDDGMASLIFGPAPDADKDSDTESGDMSALAEEVIGKDKAEALLDLIREVAMSCMGDKGSGLED